MNKDKVNKEYKKVFNKLNKLIIDISTNKNEEKDSVERLEKSISDLEQLRKKQKTDFQNKMIRVVYQFFNTLGFNEEFEPLFSEKKKSEQTEEEKPEQTEEKESEQTKEKPYNMQKPSWVNIFDENYNSLIQDVVNNLGNKNYQTTVNNQKYDLNKAKDFLLKTSTEKISKSEAQELYNNLIKPEVDAFRKSKGRSKNIRLNILNILENVESSLF